MGMCARWFAGCLLGVALAGCGHRKVATPVVQERAQVQAQVPVHVTTASLREPPVVKEHFDSDFLEALPLTNVTMTSRAPTINVGGAGYGDVPNTERYAHVPEQDFVSPRIQPLSTFGIDVDTASYTNVRRFIEENRKPPVEAVRIEELVNYFQYDDPLPQGDAPFAVSTEVGPCPWNERNRLVRVALRARAAAKIRPRANLVFLVDVSGSMNEPDKLPLVQKGLAMLVDALRPDDTVALVVYAGASGLVLPPTPVENRSVILGAISRLVAGGSTNGAQGIQLAYQVAAEAFVPSGLNRVILATDGDFNVGVTSEGALVRLIEEKARMGVFLNVLGFGRGNLNDSGMEKLADHGDGSYAYVDSEAEARRIFGEHVGGTLTTVAKDVKVQVEWNPTRVGGYRLIGYENRAMAAHHFDDDTKDGGELGAEQSVVALYEVRSTEDANSLPKLRYQSTGVLPRGNELGFVKVRHKAPAGGQSRLATFVVGPGTGAPPTPAFTFSAAVAAFGQLLRQSAHKGHATFADVEHWAERGLGWDPGGHRRAFVTLVRRASQLHAQR